MKQQRVAAEQLDALRRQLSQPYSAVLFQQRQLKDLRGVVNDVHRVVRLLQKVSKTAPPKSHKINGRIYPDVTKGVDRATAHLSE